MRRQLRRYWRELGVGTVLAGLAINVWVQDGGRVLILIAAATVGCVVAVLVPAGTSGYLVAKHAKETQGAIEATQARKRITSGDN